MKFFDILKALTETKQPIDLTDEETNKEYDVYKINRWISMCDMYLPIIAEINKYSLDKETHIRFIQNTLPKRRVFFNYIKPKKEIKAEDKKYIAHYFECSIRHVDEYIKLLTDEQIDEVLAEYEYGNRKWIDI